MLRIKYLHRMPGNALRMRSHNSAEYPDEIFSAAQIEEQRIHQGIGLGVLVVDAEQAQARGCRFSVRNGVYSCRPTRNPCGSWLAAKRHRGEWFYTANAHRTQPSADGSTTAMALSALRLGIPQQKSVCCAPHLRIDPPLRLRSHRRGRSTFSTKSHSRTQDPGVRFEGWRGLPKMNQASPREAGHKPAF
jgi:hypothetical protein